MASSSAFPPPNNRPLTGGHMAWLDWVGPSKGLCGGDPLGPIFMCSGPFWFTGLGILCEGGLPHFIHFFM